MGKIHEETFFTKGDKQMANKHTQKETQPHSSLGKYELKPQREIAALSSEWLQVHTYNSSAACWGRQRNLTTPTGLVGMENGPALLENSLSVSFKNKNETCQEHRIQQLHSWLFIPEK